MFSSGDFYIFIRARRENIEMVDWVGKFFIALEAFERFLDGLVTVSAMTQEQRESQYPADMTQLNAERRSRNEDALDPSQQGTRDNWYAAHVTTHGSQCPFNDNLTTLLLQVI